MESLFIPLCPLQEVRQGRRNVEINVLEGQRATNNNNRRQEGSIFRERKEGGNKFATCKLGQDEADEKNGLSLRASSLESKHLASSSLANSHLGGSSYSSSYVRGKRVVERGKEGKSRWRLFFFSLSQLDFHLFHHQDKEKSSKAI